VHYLWNPPLIDIAERVGIVDVDAKDNEGDPWITR
jgi:hypothetical protein